MDTLESIFDNDDPRLSEVFDQCDDNDSFKLVFYDEDGTPVGLVFVAHGTAAQMLAAGGQDE